MLKRVIFDFNGVLFWDSHFHEAAWRSLSTELRGTPFSDTEMVLNVHGRNNRHTIEYALQRRINSRELEELNQRKESLYRRLCLEHEEQFKLSPGSEKLLSNLCELNIPRTIATASEKNNLDFFIESFNLKRWFEVDQIVYDDGSRPGKPAPDIYIEAARRLSLEPKECLVIEDSQSGIEAAERAGVGYIIAVAPLEKLPVLGTLSGVDETLQSLDQVNLEIMY